MVVTLTLSAIVAYLKSVFTGSFLAGGASGTALTPLWNKIFSYVWGLFQKADPAAAADLSAAVTSAEGVISAPVASAGEVVAALGATLEAAAAPAAPAATTTPPAAPPAA